MSRFDDLQLRDELTFRTVTFVVEEKPHGRFERDGDDLICKVNISLSQALLGPEGGGSITKTINQLDGRQVEVTLPEGVSYFFYPSHRSVC